MSGSQDKQHQTLPLGALTALVVGSMIGGGVFHLPATMAQGSGALAMLIGWAISGVGMLMLAFIFQSLSNRQPHIVGAVYGYARAGYGDFAGFLGAWGFWTSALISNVFYLNTWAAALNYFFPALGWEGGTTLPAVIGSTVLLWTVHTLITLGVRGAAIVNVIATVAKIVPIVLFVICAALAFQIDTFHLSWMGQAGTPIMDQVMASMAVTVFVFIGVEGAAVYSERARKTTDVGRATVMGFVFTLAIYMSVTLLALGVVPQEQLAAVGKPSMAGVLEMALVQEFGSTWGVWGARIVNLGLIISVTGAMLSWTLLAIEMPFAGARDKVFPAWFSKLNGRDTPINALWATSVGVQIILILSYVANDAATLTINLTTTTMLLPYLLCAAYAVMSARRRLGYAAHESSGRDVLVGVVGVLYALWLIYAAGWVWALATSMLFFPGVLIYMWSRMEQGLKVFSAKETLTAVVITVACIACAILWSMGVISLL